MKKNAEETIIIMEQHYLDLLSKYIALIGIEMVIKTLKGIYDDKKEI